MENEQILLPEDAPVPGTYRHYKGSMYQVLGMAQHSETDEWMVVYQALYGKKGFWTRPLAIWLSPLDTNVVIHQNEHQTSRFTLVSPSIGSLNQLTKQE